MTDPRSAASTVALRRGLDGSTWTTRDLWVAALGLGGGMRLREVSAITSGDRAATATEHDVLATALNEWFTDQGEDHPVALWAELDTG